MSRKHKVYKGRMPSTCARPIARETIDASKMDRLVIRQRVNGWEHSELLRGTAANDLRDALGLKPGEKREERYQVASVPSLPLEPGLQNDCHAPVADKNSPTDATMVAGRWLLTVRLEQSNGKNSQRASKEARKELETVAYKFGFRVREHGRKQNLDTTWTGGSCEFTILGKVSADALSALRGMVYGRGIYSRWVGESSGTDERMPSIGRTRRQRMQLKHERARDLRKQFGVQERGFHNAQKDGPKDR